MTRRPFTEFLYRLLLVAYPSDFRRTLGGEAAGAFGQLHRDEWGMARSLLPAPLLRHRIPLTVQLDRFSHP